MNIGAVEILLIAVLWVIPAMLVFFGLYWTIRLAIRHEMRRASPPHQRER